MIFLLSLLSIFCKRKLYLLSNQKGAGNLQRVRHLENFGLSKFINKLEQFQIVLGSFKSSFSHWFYKRAKLFSLVHRQRFLFYVLRLRGLRFPGLCFLGLCFRGLRFRGLCFRGLCFRGLCFQGLRFRGLCFRDTHNVTLRHCERKVKVVNKKDDKNKTLILRSVDHFNCVKLVAT